MVDEMMADKNKDVAWPPLGVRDLGAKQTDDIAPAKFPTLRAAIEASRKRSK
jgi:hypothetical protein